MIPQPPRSPRTDTLVPCPTLFRSWTDATGGVVRNLLGPFGSYSADVMMQSLGLAALLAPLVLFACGWRLLRERELPTRWWWRLAAFPSELMLQIGRAHV